MMINHSFWSCFDICYYSNDFQYTMGLASSIKATGSTIKQWWICLHLATVARLISTGQGGWLLELFYWCYSWCWWRSAGRKVCSYIMFQNALICITCTSWVNSECSCESGSVWLVNGYTELEGRVELYRDGSLFTVCPFNQRTGSMICKRLGFSSKGIRSWQFMMLIYL